jgi:choline kinase
LIFIKPQVEQTLLETLLLTELYLPDKFILVDADIILKPESMKQFISNVSEKDFFGVVAAVRNPKYQNNHYITKINDCLVEFNKNSNIGEHGGCLYLFSNKIISKIKHEFLIDNYSFSKLITKIAKNERIILSYIDEIIDIDTYEELLFFENTFINDCCK